MTLMAFSIQDHISLLLSGKKRQTTRQSRKKPLKVGDILHCCYRPRQKKSCENCITFDKESEDCHRGNVCPDWNNFFGTAKITTILHFDSSKSTHIAADSEYPTLCIVREHTLAGFGMQTIPFMEAWARADGFANFEEAHRWFAKSIEHKKITTKKTTSDDPYLWMFLPLDIIIFEPDWVVK